MNERSLREVRALLRTWGVVRIAYGVVALFAPRVIVKLLRVQPHPDVRGFNAFLGSRDIVIGAYSIAAASNGREMDAVALNQGCEAIDTIALTQEIRAGRRADLFTIAGIGFNALGTVTWLRSRGLMR